MVVPGIVDFDGLGFYCDALCTYAGMLARLSWQEPLAPPELRARLKGLKASAGRGRTPAPRFIPSTAEVQT